ncbi:LptF/LptG family permease [Sphingobium sp.]|uniref:LptF/LptG family permease n=1 Tax=Sphingobium sp. TaxID=1912891 RepID=UPI002BB0D383|nr:LptF/LptG family permease [Sphingobium sp.]HUD92916.1 LptF/LptG family permease [Sphingobium sp.]
MGSAEPPYGHSLRLSLIDRYILVRASGPFAMALGISLCALLLERLLRLFNLLAETGSPFGVVLELAANLVPHYLGLALPAGFFIAVFVAVARLSEENELDAMLASGLSIYRLSRPYIVAGCVFAVFSILLFGFLQPYSRYAYRAILYSATNAGWGGQVQPRVFIDADKRIVLTADFVDQTGTKLKGVFLRKETPTGEQVTTAESGQFALSADRSQINLLLQNGIRLDDGPNGKPRAIKFDNILGNVAFSSDAPPFRPRGEREQELTLIELYAAIHHPGSTGINPPRLVSEFHARLVRALSLPFLPLLAIPLAMTAKRQRRSSGLVIAMLILLAYHHAVQAGESFGDTGKISADKSLWLIFSVFAIFCIWLFTRSSHRPGDNPITRSVDRVARFLDLLRGMRLPQWLRRAT